MDTSFHANQPQAFESLKTIMQKYQIVTDALFSLAIDLFERKLTKSIIAAVWIIIKLIDHIPQKIWSKCKGVIEELIKKKKAKPNLGKQSFYMERAVGPIGQFLKYIIGYILLIYKKS